MPTLSVILPVRNLDGVAPIRAKIKQIVPEFSCPEGPHALTASNSPADTLLQRAANQD